MRSRMLCRFGSWSLSFGISAAGGVVPLAAAVGSKCVVVGDDYCNSLRVVAGVPLRVCPAVRVVDMVVSFTLKA